MIALIIAMSLNLYYSLTFDFPLGSIALTRKMLEFCVRHEIYPTVEEFKMEDVNGAIAHLEEGKARFRVVLKA